MNSLLFNLGYDNIVTDLLVIPRSINYNEQTGTASMSSDERKRFMKLTGSAREGLNQRSLQLACGTVFVYM